MRKGFTLIEMLVALAVFSLAALALLNLTGESTRSAARAQTRILAGIVADNLSVEAALDHQRPAQVQTSGQVTLGGRDWRWTREVVATEDADLLRLDVRVYDGAELGAERVSFWASA